MVANLAEPAAFLGRIGAWSGLRRPESAPPPVRAESRKAAPTANDVGGRFNADLSQGARAAHTTRVRLRRNEPARDIRSFVTASPPAHLTTEERRCADEV